MSLYPKSSKVQITCEGAGVLGNFVGVTGATMANEALK